MYVRVCVCVLAGSGSNIPTNIPGQPGTPGPRGGPGTPGYKGFRGTHTHTLTEHHCSQTESTSLQEMTP